MADHRALGFPKLEAIAIRVEGIFLEERSASSHEGPGLPGWTQLPAVLHFTRVGHPQNARLGHDPIRAVASGIFPAKLHKNTLLGARTLLGVSLNLLVARMLLGWRPSLVGWRPLLLVARTLLGIEGNSCFMFLLNTGNTKKAKRVT